MCPWNSHVRERYFEDLDDTAEDYLLRIRRLETNFGGPDRRLDKLEQRISEIKDLTPRSHDRVEKAVFILEKLLGRGGPSKDELLRAIKPKMHEDILHAYQAYLWDKNVPDGPRSVLDFLERSTHINIATKNNLGLGLEKKQKKTAVKKKTKGSKTKKGQGSRKRAKKAKESTDNYQFYKRPSSSSEDWSDGEEDSSSEDETDGSSDEEEGRFNAQKGKPVCDYCQSEHTIFNCPDFFCGLSSKERRAWVKKEKRCILCLKKHDLDSCNGKRSCRFCRGPHNSILHLNKQREEVNSKRNRKRESSESDEGVIHNSRKASGNYRTSLTTLTVLVRNPSTGHMKRVNALADGGADHTVLSSRAAEWLGLGPGAERYLYKVKGHGGRSETYDATDHQIELLNPEKEKLRLMTVKCYENPCGDLSIEDWSSLKKGWKHLKDLPLAKPEGDAIVDLILGTSALDLMEAVRPSVFGPPGGPVAKLTRLGWIVGGRTTEGGDIQEKSQGRMNFSQSCRASLEELMEEHRHQIDDIREDHRRKEAALRLQMGRLWGSDRECCRKRLRNGVSPVVEDAADSKARDKFMSSLRNNEEGALEVGLLWKDKRRPPNNGRQALRVFLGMERRMKCIEGLWEEFTKTIQSWTEKGYARMLELDLSQPGYYIPTFMVIREDKTSTKYRLIVNGKYEFNGKSINDFLLSGPNVMNKLSDVLVRFRYHKYVITCDVSNMFLRVHVPLKDQKYLRFFFRNEAGDLQAVEMTSHAFGLTESPFVVMEAVRVRAQEMSDRYPDGTKAILEDSIVDDVLTGCKNFKQLLKLKTEIDSFYHSINMQAHKWASNSPGFRDTLDENERAGAVSLGHDIDELFCAEGSAVASIKCLGYCGIQRKTNCNFFVKVVLIRIHGRCGRSAATLAGCLTLWD